MVSDRKILVIVFSIMIVVSTTSGQSLGMPQNYVGQPRIITEGDIYINSQTPVRAFFKVEGFDSQGNTIPVECDKISGQIFPVGKTTVRCIAVESTIKEARTSFVVTIGYNIVQIPNWFKNTAKFWADNIISDREFIHNTEFLIKNDLLHVPTTKPLKNSLDHSMPDWIKNNAKYWYEGNISDDEFSMGLQWMIKNGIIKSE